MNLQSQRKKRVNQRNYRKQRIKWKKNKTSLILKEPAAMKYPPFSPISMNGSVSGQENVSLYNNNLHNSQDAPIYISFSIQEGYSDSINSDVSSASSIENISGCNSHNNKQPHSKPEEHAIVFSTSEMTSFSQGDTHQQSFSSSSDSTSESSNDDLENNPSLGSKCYDSNQLSSKSKNRTGKVGNFMPPSPDDTIVARNTRRKDSVSLSTRDSDDSNEKRIQIHIIPQTDSMTDALEENNANRMDRLNTPISEHKIEPPPLHQVGKFISSNLRPSTLNQTVLLKEVHKEDEANDFIPGCIFTSCSRGGINHHSEQVTAKQMDDTSFDNKKKSPHPCYEMNNTDTLCRIQGNQDGKVDFEESIELCVSNPDSPQRETQSGQFCFLKTISEKVTNDTVDTVR